MLQDKMFITHATTNLDFSLRYSSSADLLKESNNGSHRFSGLRESSKS